MRVNGHDWLIDDGHEKKKRQEAKKFISNDKILKKGGGGEGACRTDNENHSKICFFFRT